MDPIITEAREAWTRIKGIDKASFEDWLSVGRCLIAERQACMAKAGCNRPYGPAYQRLMKARLEEIELEEIDSHERVGAIYLVEHQAEIERWRAGLTDMQRRRANHPNTILAHMRRGSVPRKSGPKPSLKPRPRAYARPIFWPQEFIRRSAAAIRESRSTDCFALARAALEAAIRSEADLFALLDEAKPQPREVRAPSLVHA